MEPPVTDASEREDPDALPLLTETVDEQAAISHPARDYDTLVAELQTELSAATMNLAEGLLQAAFREMEATLFEQVSNRLRQELPELIDRTLRDHLGDGARHPSE
jgi:uncharacterized protein (DUF2267 family)